MPVASALRIGARAAWASLAAACLAAGCGGGGEGGERQQPIIAFTCGSVSGPQICTMNGDGSDVRRLTEGPANDAPSWSPDAKRIAFTSYRDGSWQIYVMNADGTDQRRLARSSSDGRAPAQPRWSPDGTKLAYVRYSGETFGPGSGADIYMMNADGADEVDLTRSPATDIDPEWSPDGRFLAFSSDRDGEQSIYLMDVQSRQVTRYTSWFAITPDFSPDGSRLAVNGPSGIYVTELAGGPAKRLTTGQWDTEPTWSPDGKTIAFRRGKVGPGAEIYVINADGTGLRRLTSNSTPDGLPAWSSVPGG